MLAALVLFACHRLPPAPDAPDAAGDTARGPSDSDPTPTDSGTSPPPDDRCLPLSRPTSDDAVALVRRWPDLSFSLPTTLAHIPGTSDDWLVAEKGGGLWHVDSAGSAERALDLSDRVVADDMETGLIGVALAPDFAVTGEVYVVYTRNEGRLESVLARFTSTDGGVHFDATTGTEVLTHLQAASSHIGGHLAFGPDGALYLGFGYSGAPDDTDAQDPWSWDGKLLRIDVRAGDPYAIPADNPFADGVAGLPEVFALGFRNPWSFGFDADGGLWVGDVGQQDWEEIDWVVAGGNYGWPIREGAHCYGAESCDTTGLLDPVAEYGRSGMEGAVIVGFVGAGPGLPALDGNLVFADAMAGTLGAIPATPEAAPLTPIPLIADAGLYLVGFGQAADGGLVAVDLGGGGLYDLAAPPTVDPVDLPPLLSLTGCMDPTDPTRPNTGLLPYGVNVPLWSDGADKERWISLPEGGGATVAPDGHWDFSVGTILVKQFRLEGTLVETRLLVHHPDGWAGYTYAWNDSGTDATLIEGTSARGFPNQDWVFPSRSQCLRCHTEAAGRSLGLTTAQLDQGTQLADLGGLLGASPGSEPTPLPALEGDAPVADRARALLDVNCSMCHRPGGTGGGAMDLRWTTPVSETGTCGIPPVYGDLTFGTSVIEPGFPGRSVLALRMRDLGPSRMPPIGSRVVDDDGVALVEAWISGMEGCED